MILHCTPPYWKNISNAPLGYLKGFLEAKGIPVKNVYWNVILSKKIEDFQKDLGNYPRILGSFPSELIIFYIFKQLVTDHEDFSGTTADLLFSSLYSREEISEAIHSIREDIDQYIQQNNLHEPSIAGFTLKTHQWLMSLYVIRRLKELNPDMTIVLGGIYNEYQAVTFMKIFNLADFAIWGEGEYPLFHLVNALEDGTPIKDVPHLVYRDDGKILSTRVPEEPCPPLDDYPFADHSDYFTTMRKFMPFNKSVFIPLWGSRACNWNKCKFCALNEEYTYRARSPENIVEEMEYQSKKYRVSNFFFTDSDIAGNKKRFLTLLHLILKSIQERRKPYLICGDISPLFIDHDTAIYMKRAGFNKVQIGFEAVTDSLLEKMQKKQKLVHNIQALKAANQCNLPLIGLNIIRGIPTETAEDVAESCTNLKFLRFLLRNYRLDPSILLLLKGSLFYDEISEEERKKWKEDLLWKEITPIHLIPEADRFEFFNFYKEAFEHYHLWDTFAQLLRFYGEQDCSYEWIETSDGSVIEEKGRKSRRYTLNRDETNILVFCDSIKKLSELTKEFSHIPEDTLRGTLGKLKDSGLLYCDEKGNTISVVDAARKAIE